MIAVDNMTDAELETAAFDVLRRELGADGLARLSACNGPAVETTRVNALTGSGTSQSMM